MFTKHSQLRFSTFFLNLFEVGMFSVLDEIWEGNLQCATEQVTGMYMEVQEFVDV